MPSPQVVSCQLLGKPTLLCPAKDEEACGREPNGAGARELLGEEAIPPPAVLAPTFALTHLCPFTLLQYSRPSRAQIVRTQPIMMPTTAGRDVATLETLALGSMKCKGRVEQSSLVPLFCGDRT